MVAISDNGDIVYFNELFTSNNGEICLEKIDISDLYYKNLYEENKSVKNVKKKNVNSERNTGEKYTYKNNNHNCPYCGYRYSTDIRYEKSCINCKKRFKWNF